MLDWIGDVGGLNEALIGIGGIILMLRHSIRGSIVDKYLLQTFFVVDK